MGIGLRIRHLTVLSLLGLVTLVQACTVYETCVNRYGSRREHLKYLSDSCSKGVTYRKNTKSRWLAESHCHSNFFDEGNLDACLYGIHLYETGGEGAVLKEGLDY